MTQFQNKSFSVGMPGNKGNWPWPDPRKPQRTVDEIYDRFQELEKRSGIPGAEILERFNAEVKNGGEPYWKFWDDQLADEWLGVTESAKR